MSATIYRLLAFFSKHDILGKYHTKILLDDILKGFASDCADFAEITENIALQESVQGHISDTKFGNVTENAAINLIIRPLVYSYVYADFHSPVLLAHKAKGLAADAKIGGHISEISLPSAATGYNSDPTYGAAAENVKFGQIFVKDYESEPLFCEYDGTIELLSSIKATVTTPVEYYIAPGEYNVQSSSPTPTAWSIEMTLFSYHSESDASVVTCSKMETKYEYVAGFQSYAWTLYFDSTMIGIYSLGTWLIFTHPDYPAIKVYFQTAVTEEQKAGFDSIFYKV